MAAQARETQLGCTVLGAAAGRRGCGAAGLRDCGTAGCGVRGGQG